jgi:hypothetical protein
MNLFGGLSFHNLRKRKRTDKEGEYIDFTKISKTFQYYIDAYGDTRKEYRIFLI